MDVFLMPPTIFFLLGFEISNQPSAEFAFSGTLNFCFIPEDSEPSIERFLQHSKTRNGNQPPTNLFQVIIVIIVHADS